jgi:hypothetical protein
VTGRCRESLRASAARWRRFPFGPRLDSGKLNVHCSPARLQLTQADDGSGQSHWGFRVTDSALCLSFVAALPLPTFAFRRRHRSQALLTGRGESSELAAAITSWGQCVEKKTGGGPRSNTKNYTAKIPRCREPTVGTQPPINATQKTGEEKPSDQKMAKAVGR